ncbi:hypothetical protein [Haloarcula salina]|nr:hypothetical protein [Haloarcula salina]
MNAKVAPGGEPGTTQPTSATWPIGLREFVVFPVWGRRLLTP